MRGFESCVWRSSLTRSMGATTVLEIPPETPPAARSMMKGGMTPASFFSEAAAAVKADLALNSAATPESICTRHEAARFLFFAGSRVDADIT